MRINKLGIIAYNTNHLKTEQIVLRLIGRFPMKVYALPFTVRPERNVLLRHRPEQSNAAHPREICEHYDLEFLAVSSDVEIDNACDLYLITGAGILSAECIRGKKVLNGHPGVIPAARGLDAFKWSIFNGTPLGITLHYIDENVDAGEVVSIVPTPVFPSDTIESLARRHYETEIDMISHFDYYLEHPQNPFQGIASGTSMRRMKRETEEQLTKKFEEYKRKFA